MVGCERDPRDWGVGAESIAWLGFVPCRPHTARPDVAQVADQHAKWSSRDDLFRVLRLASGYGVRNRGHGAASI